MIVAYIKIYSNSQKVEIQKNTIEQYAKINKIEISRWYRDTRNSSKNRNKLEEIIKGLHVGDTLIIADVSRISRKLMEIMHLVLLCIEKKIILSSIKEGYTFENNIDSKTFAFTFGLVSEIESKLISTRTKEALGMSKNNGTKLGRPLGSAQTEYLLSQKNQIEKDLKDTNTTYAELADFYNVSLSGFKRFVKENMTNVPIRRKKEQ